MTTWLPISERPPFDEQDVKQFVVVAGTHHHAGDAVFLPRTYPRTSCGTAMIAHDGPHGYRAEDIERICRDGDIDLGTETVTHWMKAEWPKVEVT